MIHLGRFFGLTLGAFATAAGARFSQVLSEHPVPDTATAGELAAALTHAATAAFFAGLAVAAPVAIAAIVRPDKALPALPWKSGDLPLADALAQDPAGRSTVVEMDPAMVQALSTAIARAITEANASKAHASKEGGGA